MLEMLWKTFINDILKYLAKILARQISIRFDLFSKFTFLNNLDSFEFFSKNALRPLFSLLLDLFFETILFDNNNI